MKKILTIILDGFGYREEEYGNAIIAAKPDNFNEIWQKYPHALLNASEEEIGLPKGQFGNSEVGHMTIGAGRVLKQDVDRINEFLDEQITDDEKYQSMIDKVKTNNSRIHIMGLFSNGLVHSDMMHFIKLYKKLVTDNIKEIYFHLITDGRDTKVDEAYEFIKVLELEIAKYKVGKIATICGRFYAMDRDNKLDRTKAYYDLVTKGVGSLVKSISGALSTCYSKKITDEFIPPILLDSEGIIKNGDILIWMNYRTDRAKQIVEPFTNLEYNKFPVVRYNDLDVYSMVPIDKKIKTIYFLEEKNIDNPLGIYFSKLGLTQARIAETEKYAHVTYFFDGEYDGPLENCTKVLVPSLKIKTYDMDPRMSAIEVTKKTIQCMQRDVDFILVNFANPDMVGHTGSFEATKKAITTVDLCLGKLLEEAENNFYKVIVTADHGNADIMIDENGEKVTTHTLSKVPFIMLDKSLTLKENGSLANIAPTILDYMDIAKPKEMQESESLIAK